MNIVRRLTIHPFAVIHPGCIYIVCIGKASYFDSIECAFFQIQKKSILYIVFYILSLKRIIFLVNRSIPVGEIIPCRRMIQYLHNMHQSFTEVFLTHVATTVGTNSIIAFPLETSREDAVVAMATLQWLWASCLQRTDAGKMPQRLLRGITLVLLHLQEKGVFPLTQDLLPSASRHAEAWGPGSAASP